MHRTTAIRPMSPSTQLRFLLAWGQGRDSQDSQSPSSRRLHSKLSNNAQRDRSVSSSVRPGGRRKRSLTYVPMSAWVKDFKDEDDIDACSMRTAGTRRSPSAERYSVASRSASLVDRVTSVSSRQSVSMPQELTELSAPPRPPPRASRSAQRSPPPPLPPPRRAPHPPPRKALPPPPSRQLLPSPIPFETPPPTPPPPPARVASASVNASVAAVAITSQRRSHRHTLNVSPAELREALAHSASRSGTHQSTAFAAPPACVTIAENVRKRRVLRRPSDVAILLHDILAGRASRCGAGETSEVFAPAAGAASAKSTKPSHGSGAGRAIKSQDDLKKQQQKWYKNLAKSRSHSSESNIVDTLAEIIAEKITRADRLRQRQDSKGDSRPPKVAASSSNHSKDKANCAPGTERKVVKVKRHSKRSSTALDSSLSRQQNCSNCYEKPPRRNHGRRLCRSHALSMQSSTEGQNRNGDCWNNGSKSFRWSAESQELCHEWGLSNRSNAGNCRPSEELFLDRNFEPSQIRVTTTPVSVCGFSERLRAEQSRQRKVPGQYDNDTASGTCSTDEDTCSVRQLSTLAVYNQQLSGVNVASVSRSSDSSKLSLSEMDANSQIATTGAQIPPIQSLHERQIRHNADFESQTTAATASYTEDLFSGLLKGRDESDLLQPMVEAPRELKLNLVPAKSGNELGGGDCADMEARISILEPESMIRSSRCEGSSVLDATQASNQDASHSFRSDVSEKLHGQQNTLHLPKTRQAPCIGCEGFNGMVKTVNKKRTALRRRSRVHVVEPLSDAVQHKIELPSCIVEQNFSSWRPLIYAQLLKQNLTFTIVEIEVPEPESQPLSIFCNHCGSSNKVDNRVPAVHSSNLCSTESTLFRFCRCIVSRISETLEVSCCLLDSSIQLAGGKVNKSMLNATHAEAAVVRSSLCLHQRCGNRQKAVSTGVCQAWPPCRFYWTNCCRGASARRVRNSECLELLQIATNLAVQSQQQRNGSDVVVNEPATGFTDCGSSLPEFSRDLSPIEPLSALGCLKRLRSIEVSSIEKYKKVGSRYFNSHFLITHCPELITKPNLDFVSEVQEDSDDCPHGKHDQRTLQQQMPQQSWSSHKTATSENSSSESSVLTPGGRLPQPSDLYNNLYYKAAGDKLASPSHCQDKAVVPPHPHAGAADEGAGRSLPSLQSCSSRSFPSSSLCDVTPRFNEQIAAPVLSITCQLTVADQTSDANTSDSFEESLPAGDLA